MPITPFHFGPGLLLHSVAPRSVSFSALIAANILIDVESAYFLITGGVPVHRTLHTFAVAPLAGLAAGWLVYLLWRFLEKRSAFRAPTLSAGLLGGLLGGLTHAVLDGVMHADMRPFWPFSAANPLLGWTDLVTLHLFCVATGVIGILVLAVQQWRGRFEGIQWRS
ncbi:MAG TPA: hypothetical protein VFI91_04290 [Longimicrobiaceae bacterium]|nr:hypothetical protein [Longimicrobiaceae bacterium]